jgi:hypothetical protein
VAPGFQLANESKAIAKGLTAKTDELLSKTSHARGGRHRPQALAVDHVESITDHFSKPEEEGGVPRCRRLSDSPGGVRERIPEDLGNVHAGGQPAVEPELDHATEASLLPPPELGQRGLISHPRLILESLGVLRIATHRVSP